MGERRSRRRALVLAGLWLIAAPLAGCLHPVKHNQAAALPEAASTAAPKAPEGAAPETGAPGVASLPPIDDDPDHMMGKDTAALRALLGAPGFLRRDNPAQLWRYVGQGCMLDIYLYRSGPAGTYVVRHLAARPSPVGGPAVSARACLGALLRAHRRAGPG